jgi:hypothetical protein
MRENNMSLDSANPGKKNDCAGEGQQKCIHLNELADIYVMEKIEIYCHCQESISVP